MTVRLLVSPGEIEQSTVTVRGDDHHYLFRVRRLASGDSVLLFDGHGREAPAVVTAVTAVEATLARSTPVPAQTSQGPEITMGIALIKGERMDWAVAKLAELGVGRIAPMTTARTVVRLSGARAASRVDRYRQLARAAAAQSRNATVAQVDSITDLPGVLAGLGDADLKLVGSTAAACVPLRAAMPSTRVGRAVALVGPEGGFDDAELLQIRSAGFVAVSLGSSILRSETASVALASTLRLMVAQAWE